MKTNLIFIITLLLAVTGMCLTYTKADEEVTETLELSTYYPAPYGEYDELYVSKWLELDRTGIDTGELRLAAPDTTGTTNTLWDFHNRGTDTGFGAIAGGDGNKLYLTYYDGTTWSEPYIVVDTSGRVGIGTTGPRSILDVARNLYIGDGIAQIVGTGQKIVFPDNDYSSAATGPTINKIDFYNQVNQYGIGVHSIGNLDFFTDRHFRFYEDVDSTKVERFTILGDTYGGNVGIGTTPPSAILDVSSTSSGFLPPRMTSTQRKAISSPVAGMVVYDTTLRKLCVYTGTWEMWRTEGAP